jgi:hypothetical protein
VPRKVVHGGSSYVRFNQVSDKAKQLTRQEPPINSLRRLGISLAGRSLSHFREPRLAEPKALQIRACPNQLGTMGQRLAGLSEKQPRQLDETDNHVGKHLCAAVFKLCDIHSLPTILPAQTSSLSLDVH